MSHKRCQGCVGRKDNQEAPHTGALNPRHLGVVVTAVGLRVGRVLGRQGMRHPAEQVQVCEPGLPQQGQGTGANTFRDSSGKRKAHYLCGMCPFPSLAFFTGSSWVLPVSCLPLFTCPALPCCGPLIIFTFHIPSLTGSPLNTSSQCQPHIVPSLDSLFFKF